MVHNQAIMNLSFNVCRLHRFSIYPVLCDPGFINCCILWYISFFIKMTFLVPTAITGLSQYLVRMHKPIIEAIITSKRTWWYSSY